ncbi:sigma-70 family RNA polymerase sigma factor [Mucilaginibacter sp.]|uniref:sigma-70 family RNA polymerase sigma factor n=1 Tax=Mucilaginibacter sp. TaxID=1882438 RepID=UPI002639EBEF|nr:sigma-70 family RNA polymerase sigma factor [Mucilaginibacter sp.]MDB4925981.1 polymerase sigma-70 factor [Mucilaginibacter sp.]
MKRTLNSDDELLLHLKQGNIYAYNEIFDRYWKKLYAIAYNRLRSKQASEDVVQDVLSSLWMRRTELEIDNLSHYLGTSIRYAVFRQINKSIEKIQLSADELVSDDPFTEPAIFQLMDYQILKKYLEQKVNKLPEKCQIVFKYSREQHLTNKTIAEMLNLSEKTIEAHITKALKYLKLALKNF